MKHTRIIVYIATILSLLLSACTKEVDAEDSYDYTGERLPMNMRVVNAKLATDDSSIESVRIIIFSAEGKLVCNKLVENKTTTATGVNFNMEVARGLNHFHIICNETEPMTALLDKIIRQEDIENITFMTAGITPPIPMYGKVSGVVSANRDGTNVQVMVDGRSSTTLTIDADRLMAKINLTIIKNVTDQESDFSVEEIRVKVCRIPKYTTLKPNQPYTSSQWADNISFTGSGSLQNNGAYTITNVDGINRYEAPSDVDKVTFPNIYIAEHILNEPVNTEEATYLLIDTKCRAKTGNTQLMHSIYIVNIGENPPANHNIKRNNHYDIYATIKSMGAMGIYAEIVAMDMYNLPINWKPAEGLVIVSDKESDFDYTTGTNKNVNVWNDYTVYSGILKVYHSKTGYKDVLFKYGSLIAVNNDLSATTDLPFIPPADDDNLGDIVWYPHSYGNPATKITSWSDIPFLANGDIPTINSKTETAAGRGDPCKLVGLSDEQIANEGLVNNNQWRIATPADYAILHLASNNDPNSYGYKTFHRHILPNVKDRNTSGTLAASAGGTGSYWTTEGVQAFDFSSQDPSGAGLAAKDASQGLTVRCVRTSIPASEMLVASSPTISYQGNITTGATFTINSNIPYWTATLIDDINDPNYGGNAEFDDFSFAPGATNLRTTSGAYSQSVPVYIKRKESNNSRKFNIRVTGMGYDGRKETVILSATQSGYILQGHITFLPIISSTNRIPAEGATYTATITLTPTDIAIPAGKLQIRVGYNGVNKTQSTAIATEPNKYLYEGLTLTVPKNETPDVIGVDFTIHLGIHQIGGVHYYQNKP